MFIYLLKSRTSVYQSVKILLFVQVEFKRLLYFHINKQWQMMRQKGRLVINFTELSIEFVKA